MVVRGTAIDETFVDWQRRLLNRANRSQSSFPHYSMSFFLPLFWTMSLG